MATNDYTKGTSRVRWGASERDRVFLLENVLDCAKDNQTADDVAKMLTIPAGMYVHHVWLDIETAEGGTLTIDAGDGDDVDGWHDGVEGNSAASIVYTPKTGSVSLDPGSLADGVGETKAVTVTGAALGNFVEVSFSLDIQEITVSGAVSAADTVEIRLQNETTGTIDLAAGTVYAKTRSHTEIFSDRGGKLYTSADTIDLICKNNADLAKIRIVACVSQVFNS